MASEQEIPVRGVSGGRKFHRLAIKEAVLVSSKILPSIEVLVEFVRARALKCPTQRFYVKWSEDTDELYVTQYEPKDGK